MATMEREFEHEPEPDHRPRLITQELAREIAYAINDVLERRERHDLRFEIFIPGKTLDAPNDPIDSIIYSLKAMQMGILPGDAVNNPVSTGSGGSGGKSSGGSSSSANPVTFTCTCGRTYSIS